MMPCSCLFKNYDMTTKEKILNSLNIISIEIEKINLPRLTVQVKTDLHATICKEITQIRNTLEEDEARESEVTKPSYAEKVSKNLTRTAGRSNAEALNNKVSNKQIVLIYPEDDMNSNQTRELFKIKINPADLRVGINNVRTIGNGGLAVETSSEADADTIKKALNKENSGKKLFNYKTPTNKKPCIVIYGVDKSTPPETIPEQIRKQNGLEITDEDLKYKFTLGARSNPNPFSINYVFEVEPRHFKEITAKQKLYIGMCRCSIKKFIVTTRCFHCNAFGHPAKYCKTETRPACGTCAEEHQTKECANKETKKCINCTRYNNRRNITSKRPVNHNAYDRDCPCYKDTVALIESRTDYG